MMKKTKYTTIIGSSGSGKTSGILVPEIRNTIREERSFLVTDSRNEILEYIGSELKENHYNVVVLNLRNRTQSDRWNPLIMPYEEYKNGNSDRAYSLLNDIANTIFYSESVKKDDPFWDISAGELFTGLAFGLFEDANSEEEINLRSVYNMEIVGNKKMGLTNFLSEYYESKENKFGFTASGLRGTVVAPNDTKSSILAVFNQKLRHLSMSDKYISILCDSTFNMDDCLNGKTAFILQFEDEKSVGAKIINVFVKQVYELLVEKNTTERTIQHFDMFFEDFLSMDYLPYLDKLIMGAKNRNIALFFSINSFSLLKKMYGEYVSNALLENSDEIVLTDLYDVELLRYLKELRENDQIPNDIFSERINLYEYIKITKDMGIKRNMMSHITPKCFEENFEFASQKEIKCFDFEAFVMNLRGKKAEMEFDKNGMMPFDIDNLVAKIDKKIKELEEEEKKQEQ